MFDPCLGTCAAAAAAAAAARGQHHVCCLNLQYHCVIASLTCGMLMGAEVPPCALPGGLTLAMRQHS
jgi:hypothetical protein